MGARNRYAGTLLALGHGIIELPLMIFIILGMEKLLKSAVTQTIIGLAGGAFLLIMAIQMLIKVRTSPHTEAKIFKGKPVLAGIVLSAGNPYFLIWWATVGLALATRATKWGIWAFALFAIVHWLCDLVWLQLLSWASFKGSTVLGPRRRCIVLLICALALLAFGLFFIYSATRLLVNLTFDQSAQQ
jgi:threonine/homoserine/homoserine lactone efflux protein